jgi:hypothetical protein
VPTIWIFIQEFILCLFHCLKMALVCEFQHSLLYEMKFFSQGFICLVDMRFCGHVPNSHRNKNLKFVDPYLL